MTRPLSCAPSRRRTRTSPVRGVDLDLGEVGDERQADLALRVRVRGGRRRRSICCCCSGREVLERRPSSRVRSGRRSTPSFRSSEATSRLQLLGRHLEELPLHVERGRAHGGRVDVHRLAAARATRVLRRGGVGVVDLDARRAARPSSSATTIAMHGLGAGADVARAHVSGSTLPSATSLTIAVRARVAVPAPHARGDADAADDRAPGRAAARAPPSSRRPSAPSSGTARGRCEV